MSNNANIAKTKGWSQTAEANFAVFKDHVKDIDRDDLIQALCGASQMWYEGVAEIASLQKENEKLKADNEDLKLRKEIVDLKENLEVSEDNVMNITAERDELGGEIEKLKEENVILRDQVNTCVKEFIDEDEDDDEPRCDYCDRTHDEVMHQDNKEDAWNGETGCCKKCENSASH